MFSSYEDAWERLCDLFADIPTIQLQNVRTGILAQMRTRRCELTVIETGQPRVDAINILNAALEQKGAVEKLRRVLRIFDRSDKCSEFVDLVRELLPSEFFELEERFNYLEFIESCIPTEELTLYYTLAMNENPDSDFRDADALVRELEQMLPQQDCHPLVLLTEAIAQRTKSDTVRKQAEKWSERVAENIDANNREPFGPGEQQKLEDSRKVNYRVSASWSGPSTLTLMLEPSGALPDQYLFSAALYRSGHRDPVKIRDEDDPVSLEDAKAQVMDVLRLATAYLFPQNPDSPDSVKPTLEFILPRKLLCYPIEQWQMTESGVTLEWRFVVVVRDIKRQNDPLLYYDWQEKWQYMMRDDGAAGSGLAKWITCLDPPSAPCDLNRQLSPAEFHSLGLTFCPPQSGGWFDLTEVLDAGTPVAIWPQSPSDHGNGAAKCTEFTCHGLRFKAKLSDLLASRRITDLPDLVRQMRRANADAADSPRGLTLLWDDPRRLVKPWNHRLRVPGSPEGI
jgi:hypothetical protein